MVLHASAILESLEGFIRLSVERTVLSISAPATTILHLLVQDLRLPRPKVSYNDGIGHRRIAEQGTYEEYMNMILRDLDTTRDIFHRATFEAHRKSFHRLIPPAC